MTDGFDVAVVGGGPAGLAAAAFASRAGLSTVLFERQAGPPDKACGEGLMPAGVRVLESLGATSHLTPADWHAFVGIRYFQEDGSRAEGRLPGGGGRGIRRTALVSALARCAEESGVELRWDCGVDGFSRSDRMTTIRSGTEAVRARVLIAADGLLSRMRHLAGLERPASRRQRFGLRQHFQVKPWSEWVEVHLREGVEAFVTPAGESRVGVAFLWERSALPVPASIGDFLQRFPALEARLAGAPIDSHPRSAGPLAQATHGCTADGVVLVGDAGGHVDAITGEGVSLALTCAQALGALLPAALAEGATRKALRCYERFHAREFRRYALVCRVLLTLARRPAIRRPAVHFLGRHPRLFDRLIAAALA
jgi:flavin-dependent dehydrogenase